MPSKKKKIRFLKKVYFGVSNHPDDDVNPYDNLEVFTNSLVKDMDWGHDEDVRQRSKLRFAFNYHNVLQLYNVHLTIEDIYLELKDDLTNKDVIEIWSNKSTFV